MWKPKLLDQRKPKYLAIADALEADISCGRVAPGEQLPPQRELADSLSVNLSTVSRAYREAETRGLTAGTVGKGTFVSADVSVNLEMIERGRQEYDQIEMSLVLPFQNHEPDLGQRVSDLARNTDCSSFSNYSDPCGLPEHRQIGAQWAARFSLDVSPDQVIVTAGAQHALTSIFAALFKPGSRIAVDQLTYPGLKALANMMHIRLAPVMMDEQGMIPEQLDAVCRSNPIEGIYLMPACQNPTGISMPAGRREQIAALIKKHSLLLLEDDAYYFTADESQPALSTLLPDHSLFLAGFSKILFGGMRTAFVITAEKYREQIIRAVLNTIWMAPTLNAAILCSTIEDGTIDKVIGRKLKEAQARNKILQANLPLQSSSGPSCGFYRWCALPDSWSPVLFEERARRNGVNVFCEEKFSVGSSPAGNHIRIATASPATRQELGRGIALLKATLDSGASPIDLIN